VTSSVAVLENVIRVKVNVRDEIEIET